MIGTLAQFLTPSRWQLALGLSLPTELEAVTTPRTGPMPEMNRWLGPLSPAAWERQPGSARLDPESEATVLALLRAWTSILRPWLDGASELNYERLRVLAAVLNPAVGVILPQSLQARPPIEELPAAGPTSPYAIVDWPLSGSGPDAGPHRETVEKSTE